MGEVPFSRLEPVLDEILFLLRVLVRLSIPVPDLVMGQLRGEQGQVYLLCDSTRSIEAICGELGKSGSQIRKTLTRLRRKGIIDSVNRGKVAYYFRVRPAQVLEDSADSSEVILDEENQEEVTADRDE